MKCRMSAFRTCGAIFSWFVIWSFNARAEVVRYDLTVEMNPVNISGIKSVDFALTVNGGIPAPTLEFTEGDDAEITVHNHLKAQETSIHWHGILLPPLMDGVPYVTTPPIGPGKAFTYRFKVRQNGTFWYHSHTGLQEQKGVFGAIVIHPKVKLKVDKDIVVMLSDWSDENADQIVKNLRKSGDYYQFKKDTVRSYFGATGAGGLKNHLANEWSRMGGMDVSDVGYDAFLINGKKDQQLLAAKAGEKIRLRIINAGASSYFYVSLAGLPMQVIAADGKDIRPVTAKEILLGMAETYDVLFTVPEQKNFELRATSQDVTGFASAWIGEGEKVSAPTKTRPDLYAKMDHQGHPNHQSDSHQSHESHQMMNHGQSGMADHSAHGHMGHMESANEPMTVVETLTGDDIQSPHPTVYSGDHKVIELKLILGGDMERYVWHINGKAIYQDRNIEVNEGDIVRFQFKNETMMHHPMHLHGHFFRVLNRAGEYSPLKHTVDVSSHGERTIEFLANEPGQWMLHCHNLYHMKTGMARFVTYRSFTPSPEVARLQHMDPHMHDHLYYDGMAELATNHAQAKLRLSKTWDTFEGKAEVRDYNEADQVEADLFYRRWVSNYLNIIVGGVHYGEYEESRTRAAAGVGYLLPMLIHADLLIDHRGDLRLDLEKKFQWTKHWYSDVDFSLKSKAKTEFEVSLMYARQWSWSVGLMATEDSLGVGGQYRF